MTFETFDQSDEETWHDQIYKDKYKDNDKDKDILRIHPKSNPRDLWPLIRVMRKHDLTKKDLPIYIPVPTNLLPPYLSTSVKAILETFETYDQNDEETMIRVMTKNLISLLFLKLFSSTSSQPFSNFFQPIYNLTVKKWENACRDIICEDNFQIYPNFFENFTLILWQILTSKGLLYLSVPRQLN